MKTYHCFWCYILFQSLNNDTKSSITLLVFYFRICLQKTLITLFVLWVPKLFQRHLNAIDYSIILNHNPSINFIHFKMVWIVWKSFLKESSLNQNNLLVKNMEFCLTIYDREIRIWRTDFGNMTREDTFTYK